jgi:hypothetical protein
MARFKTDAEGNLLDADGKPLVIGDEPVKLSDIEGAKTQKDIDTTVEQRLARQTERIRTLEAQANKTPELERLLEGLKSEKGELERQVQQVKETAQSEAQAQLTRVSSERDQFKQALDAEKAARVRDQVSTAILAAAKDKFNDPAIDVVPHLLNAHKREPQKDAQGKDTGKFVDFFLLRYKNDKGEEVEEYLPVEKALEVWGAQHPHHVRPSGGNGSGGGQYGASDAGNPWQKATWNVTNQMKLMAENPAKARSLMNAAGVPVPAGLG